MGSPLSNIIEKKILRQERLSVEEGLFLLDDAPLLWLGRLASEERFRRFPQKEVTFVLDTNPNYTNVCETACQFCAFYRHSEDPDAYTLSVDEVMEKIDKAVQNGVTTVLLQGGHNDALPLDYYLSLVRETKKRFPTVTPHFFSASEIQMMSRVSGLSVIDVLRKLKEAGQTSLPGGGAEILSDRVRDKISPQKGGPSEWLSVHSAAHELGFLSTATMMYGHVEESEDVAEHWEAVRQLQDESKAKKMGGHFTAFVPWSFKPENTALERRFPRRAGTIPYLRMIAASRLYLDNIDHIQASWFSEGKKVGQTALQFGADDFGGTLFEENVHAEAGFVNTTTPSEVITLIHEAGFDAVQRTTDYQRIKTNQRSDSGSSIGPLTGAGDMPIRKNTATPIDFVSM